MAVVSQSDESRAALEAFWQNIETHNAERRSGNLDPERDGQLFQERFDLWEAYRETLPVEQRPYRRTEY